MVTTVTMVTVYGNNLDGKVFLNSNINELKPRLH